LKDIDQRIGEVVEASTAGFTVQCYELYGFPPLGSLVKCPDGEQTVIAVTANAATTSLEPGRRPIARGYSARSEQDIMKAHPQLGHLLKSQFEAMVVGFLDANGAHQYLPAGPLRLHSFIYPCDTADVVNFSQCLDFLLLLAGGSSVIPAEELLAACVRQVSLAHSDANGFITRAARNLAEYFSNDYLRLRNILKRLAL